VITFIATTEIGDRRNTLDMNSDDKEEYEYQRKEASACLLFQHAKPHMH
jgi:hypothetical protein